MAEEAGRAETWRALISQFKLISTTGLVDANNFRCVESRGRGLSAAVNPSRYPQHRGKKESTMETSKGEFAGANAFRRQLRQISIVINHSEHRPSSRVLSRNSAQCRISCDEH